MTETSDLNLTIHLDLRRRVIHAAGFKKLRLLDVYGEPKDLWAGMGKEFEIQTVILGEAKPPGKSPASLPLFIEAIGRMRINVVEIELAGDPWELWAGITKRLVHQTAIFLTLPGRPRRKISKFTRAALGIPAEWEIPEDSALVEFAARYFLVPRINGTEIRSAWRAFDGQSTTFGALARPVPLERLRPGGFPRDGAHSRYGARPTKA
jgi:hypothetical protein